METNGYTNSDMKTPTAGLEAGIGLSRVLLSNKNGFQIAGIEELRDAYQAGLSSGPSIEITVDELLVRFKASLNEQTKI